MPVLRSTAPGRSLATRRGLGVLLELLAQLLDLLLGLMEAFLELGLTPERRCPGAGSHPYAVLRHPLELDQTLRHQHRNTVSQHLVEKLHLLDSEVRQGVMVDRDPAADPAVRIVLLRQAFNRPRTPHPLHRRIEPQSQVNPRIRRGTARPALHRLDLRIKRPQFERLHELPHRSRRVIHRQKTLQIHRPQLHLRTVRNHHTRTP